MRSFAVGGFIFRICSFCSKFDMFSKIWSFKTCQKMRKNVHLRAKCSCCDNFGMFSKNLIFFNVQKCTFESNDVHLRAMMYTWEQNSLFWQIWDFSKISSFLLNVRKCTLESNDVHLRAKCSFCGKFGVFLKI